MIEKTMPIHVEESREPIAEVDSEQIQDQEMSQQIEDFIKEMDMELEQEQ